MFGGHFGNHRHDRHLGRLHVGLIIPVIRYTSTVHIPIARSFLYWYIARDCMALYGFGGFVTAVHQSIISGILAIVHVYVHAFRVYIAKLCYSLFTYRCNIPMICYADISTLRCTLVVSRHSHSAQISKHSSFYRITYMANSQSITAQVINNTLFTNNIYN